ncbi:MAG: replication initiator protein A [Planctomycetaceae bacterium]|nr:replication initiator protein A [Planctomycetaceae bacterium]
MIATFCYELACKHCGRQREWRVSLELLQKKCGAVSTPREFRRLMSNIVREDRLDSHIPDYSAEFDGEDLVLFRSRGTVNAGEQKELFDNTVRLSGPV